VLVRIKSKTKCKNNPKALCLVTENIPPLAPKHALCKASRKSLCNALCRQRLTSSEIRMVVHTHTHTHTSPNPARPHKTVKNAKEGKYFGYSEYLTEKNTLFFHQTLEAALPGNFRRFFLINHIIH
jgi:hypothetical protein